MYGPTPGSSVRSSGQPSRRDARAARAARARAGCSRAPATRGSRPRGRGRRAPRRSASARARQPARDHARDLRLLQHHLGDEDRVRVARPAPRQVAPVLRRTSRAGARARAMLAVDQQALQRAEAPSERRDTCGSRRSFRVPCPSRRSRSSCSSAIGRQRSSMTSRAVAGDLSSGARGARPRAAAACRGRAPVVDDDVHLGVVEQRVLVQVRRADVSQRSSTIPTFAWTYTGLRAPAPVCAERASRGSGRRRRRPRRARRADRACRRAPLFGLRGQHDDQAEVVVRGVAQLVGEDPDDLAATRGTGSRGRSSCSAERSARR